MTVRSELPYDPFRSARLSFTAIDSPQDDEIFHILHRDIITYSQANPDLQKPVGRKRTASLQKAYQEALFGAMINIITDKGEIPIGAVSLFLPHGPSGAHHGTADLAIGIASQYQNKGYGTEAVQWVLKWGFEQAHLHRVSLEILGWNKVSIRFFEKLGFRNEKVEKESWWHNGDWHDSVGMAMLIREWKALQEKVPEKLEKSV